MWRVSPRWKPCVSSGDKARCTRKRGFRASPARSALCVRSARPCEVSASAGVGVILEAGSHAARPGGGPMWRLRTLASQMLLGVLCVLVVTTVVGALLYARFSRQTLDTQYEERARTAA